MEKRRWSVGLRLTTYCPWNNEGIIPSIVVPSIFNSSLSKSCEKTNSTVVRRRRNDVSLTIRQNSWMSCWQNSSGLSQLEQKNSFLSLSSNVRRELLPKGSRQFLRTDDVVTELEIVENLLKSQWHTVQKIVSVRRQRVNRLKRKRRTFSNDEIFRLSETNFAKFFREIDRLQKRIHVTRCTDISQTDVTRLFFGIPTTNIFL